MTQSTVIKRNGKKFIYTGKYAWKKANADALSKKAKKLGYNTKIVKLKTKLKKKTGYGIYAQAKTTKSKRYDYVWVKKK